MISKIQVQNSHFSILKWYIFPRTRKDVCFNQLTEVNAMTLFKLPFLFRKLLTNVGKFLKINTEPGLVWPSWLEHHPTNQNVMALIPVRAMPGLQVRSQLGCIQEATNQCSLLLSPPSLSLSLKTISMSSGEDKNQIKRKLNIEAKFEM